MHLNFLSCNQREKYPKSNVSSRKSVKKKSKKHKKSSTHRRRLKPSYVSSSLFSKNFYPANYFFQNDYLTHINDDSPRVGVNDQNGFLITHRNPPQLPLPPRKALPSSRLLLQQYQNQQHHYLHMKVGSWKNIRCMSHVWLLFWEILRWFLKSFEMKISMGFWIAETQ